MGRRTILNTSFLKNMEKFHVFLTWLKKLEYFSKFKWMFIEVLMVLVQILFVYPLILLPLKSRKFDKYFEVYVL